MKHDINLLEKIANDVACGHAPDGSYSHEMTAMWHRMNSELAVFRREVPDAYVAVPVSTDGMPEAPGQRTDYYDPEKAAAPDPNTPPKPFVQGNEDGADTEAGATGPDWHGNPLIPGSVAKKIKKSREHAAVNPTKAPPGLGNALPGQVVPAPTRKKKPKAAPPPPPGMHSDTWSDEAREAAAEARKANAKGPQEKPGDDDRKAAAEAAAKAQHHAQILSKLVKKHPEPAVHEAAAEAADHAHRAAEHARAAAREQDPALAEHHAHKAAEHAGHAEHALHRLEGHGSSKLRDLFHLLVGESKR